MRDIKPWLCFSGGNALGAFHAGAYQSLHESGIKISRIGGASIGAVTGALIAGNLFEQRLPRLKKFWRTVSDLHFSMLPGSDKRRSAFQALLLGKSGMFQPSFPGLWSALSSTMHDEALFDTKPQRETLKRLVDFAQLSKHDPPLVVTTLDAETGEDVSFDSQQIVLEVDHIMASTALPVLFPHVEIDGRKFFDPGLSANLPLRALFAQEPAKDVLCICFDLFALEGSLRPSLDAALGRATDLIFANQTKHALHDLKNRFNDRDGPHITIIHVPYRDQAEEVGMKTFDYSRRSIDARWRAGQRDAMRVLEAMDRLAPRNRVDIYTLNPTGLLDYLA